MQHDFVYGIRFNPRLAAEVQEAQLLFELSAEQGSQYHLSKLLRDEVIVARVMPEPYQTLTVGLVFAEQIDGRTYFNAYQIPDGKLTIVPRVAMDLADTQFNDVTQEVCIARTVMGAVMNAVSNEDLVQVDHTNSFNVIHSTLVFGFQLDVQSKEKSGDRAPFEVFGFGQALGRVSLEEVTDDSDIYDDTTNAFLAFIKATQG